MSEIAANIPLRGNAQLFPEHSNKRAAAGVAERAGERADGGAACKMADGFHQVHQLPPFGKAELRLFPEQPRQGSFARANPLAPPGEGFALGKVAAQRVAKLANTPVVGQGDVAQGDVLQAQQFVVQQVMQQPEALRVGWLFQPRHGQGLKQRRDGQAAAVAAERGRGCRRHVQVVGHHFADGL